MSLTLLFNHRQLKISLDDSATILSTIYTKHHYEDLRFLREIMKRKWKGSTSKFSIQITWYINKTIISPSNNNLTLTSLSLDPNDSQIELPPTQRTIIPISSRTIYDVRIDHVYTRSWARGTYRPRTIREEKRGGSRRAKIETWRFERSRASPPHTQT